MQYVLGIDGKLWRNTGTYAEPVWNLVDNVKNLRLPLKKTEADVTRRGSGKVREIVSVLLEAELNFEMVHDPSDADMVAVRTAFIDDSAIEFAIADGPMTGEGSVGTEYFRAYFTVLDFSRNEDLEAAMERTVAMKPTPDPNAANNPAVYGVVS